MVRFKAVIQKFKNYGDKTGWTYIEIPEKAALKLKPDNKKSFRVKGTIDDYKIEAVALMPMGNGSFIMALNAAMRKGICKQVNDTVLLNIEEDKKGKTLNKDLVICLKEEPKAFDYFNTLTKGHQQYFSNWIDSAKTEQTKTKRIAQTVNAMLMQMDYGQMIRYEKEQKNKLGF